MLPAVMLAVHSIDSLDDPRCAPYRTLRRPLEHRAEGLLVAEGEKVVRRLVASEFEVVSLLLPEKWLPVYEALLASRPAVIPAFVAPKPVLEALTGISMYQGVLAVGRIPPPLSLATLLARSAPPRLLVAIDQLADAGNVGVMVRNCAALGAHGLIVGPTSSSPYLRKAVRASMGAVFQLPILESADLAGTLLALRAQGVSCVGAHLHPEHRPLSQARLAGDCCLVLGSEGEGLTPAVLAACDQQVVIPMAPGVDSLNVAMAGGIFLYEARRQRGGA